jgi:predicted RNA-binding protein with RPS1 domain
MEAIFNFSIAHLDKSFVKKIKSLFSENAKVEFKVLTM